MKLSKYDDISAEIIFRLDSVVDSEELLDILEYDFDDFGSEYEIIEFIIEYLIDNIKQELRYIVYNRNGSPYDSCIDWKIRFTENGESYSYRKGDYY